METDLASLTRELAALKIRIAELEVGNDTLKSELDAALLLSVLKEQDK